MSIADAAAPPPGAPVPDVRFIGAPRAYWWLLVRGAALLAVTLDNWAKIPSAGQSEIANSAT